MDSTPHSFSQRLAQLQFDRIVQIYFVCSGKDSALIESWYALRECLQQQHMRQSVCALLNSHIQKLEQVPDSSPSTPYVAHFFAFDTSQRTLRQTPGRRNLFACAEMSTIGRRNLFADTQTLTINRRTLFACTQTPKTWATGRGGWVCRGRLVQKSLWTKWRI